nr:multidrug efflux SMR transporter [Numidum massiliense]
MNRHWFVLIVAAVIEVFWVIGLKHAEGVWAWSGTFVAMVVSNYLLIVSGRVLPVGTAYAVYVGLGTVGTVLAEMTIFGEPFELVKVLLILVLLSGVIGLKVVTEEKTPEGANS